MSNQTHNVIEFYERFACVGAIYYNSAEDQHTVVTSAYTTTEEFEEVACAHPPSGCRVRVSFVEAPDVGVNVWQREAGANVVPFRRAGAESETIDVRAKVAAHFSDFYGTVVHIVCAPADKIRPGEQCRVSLLLRLLGKNTPIDLLRVLDARATELRKLIPEIVQIQVAPELNFPPQGTSDPDDPDLELKGEVMRIVEPFKLVVAAWFEAADPEYGTPASVALYGEHDRRLIDQLHEIGVRVRMVAKPEQVPPSMTCIFNPITRLLKAQAEGDAAEVDRIREAMRAHEIVVAKVAPPDQQVPCRWCAAPIPASTSPAYAERCPSCSAIQNATTIQTKSKEMPLISVFVNPDRSLFVEFVFAPPEPNRFDLSEVWRYRVDPSLCEHFDAHPMGKKDPQ